MTHAYDPELAPWAPIFAQLSFADIPAARAGESDLLAALPESACWPATGAVPVCASSC